MNRHLLARSSTGRNSSTSRVPVKLISLLHSFKLQETNANFHPRCRDNDTPPRSSAPPARLSSKLCEGYHITPGSARPFKQICDTRSTIWNILMSSRSSLVVMCCHSCRTIGCRAAGVEPPVTVVNPRAPEPQIPSTTTRS